MKTALFKARTLGKKNITQTWLTPAKAKPEAHNDGCERLWRCPQLLPQRDQKGPGFSLLPSSKLLYPPYGVCEDNIQTLDFYVHSETLGYPSNSLICGVRRSRGESGQRRHSYLHRSGYGDNIQNAHLYPAVMRNLPTLGSQWRLSEELGLEFPLCIKDSMSNLSLAKAVSDKAS